jgi:predicted RNA-binding Zn-ribbon protein involved in translation (DUF1610 family)
MGSFSLTQWIIVAVIGFVIYKIINGSSSGRITTGKATQQGSMICPNCGTQGEPKSITQGNILIELVLWLCFIIPGVIYSIWRLSSRKEACPACGQTGMIGITTPNGQLLLKKYAAIQDNARQ